MNKEKITNQRGEVVDKFINIEWIINAIISQYYLNRVETKFVLQVLYDEYFSFSLKRRIIEKIFPKIDKSKLNDLNRLNSIRNCFAHCTNSMTLNNSLGEYIPDPRDHSKPLDFDSLYLEFMKKEGEVNKYFYELYLSLGGKATKKTFSKNI